MREMKARPLCEVNGMHFCLTAYISAECKMISNRVHEELVQTQQPVITHALPVVQAVPALSTPMVLNYGITFGYTPDRRVQNRGKAWTKEEHERFLVALEMYPRGPWKAIAAHVGTKTARQAMTHSQKCREKIARRRRVLEQQLVQIELARAEAMLPLTMFPLATVQTVPVQHAPIEMPKSSPLSSFVDGNLDEVLAMDECLMLFHPEYEGEDRLSRT